MYRITSRSQLPDKTTWWILGALFLSLILNSFTVRHVLANRASYPVKEYSYVSDNHPRELPIELDTVAMTFDDSEHYNISSFDAWLDWESLTSFPNGSAYVQLEPNGREFGLSMFRQLRCLNILRVALIDGPGDESKRCLNLLRQAILCASDITLDALNIEIDGQLKATDGAGMTHVCRDWTQVYAFVRENQRGSTL